MRELPDHTDPDVRAAAVRAAAVRQVDPRVLASLSASTPAQERSLRALAEGACVVTGQQAGLFGGPLYTLHKAASAIVDARALEQETGVPVAPVFWLQDEDHDFEEIASVTLVDREGSLQTATVDGLEAEAGCSVWARRFGPSIEPALDVLEGCLGDGPHAEAILDLVRATHTPESSPATAFRALIERLFAAHGLLVLDPADPSLRAAAAPVHQRGFERAEPIAVALQAQADALVEAGRPAPVYIRPGAPLSFFHPDGPTGPRYRIEPVDSGTFRLCGTERTVPAEVVYAGAHSTSALQRPILQDTWLPTAAYVGGPGELAYLTQLPSLWDAYDLPTPLIVPRGRFLLVDAVARRLLEALQLTPADLKQTQQELLARLGTPRDGMPDPDALHEELTAQALAALEAFAPTAAKLPHHGLKRALRKTTRTIEHAAARFVDRYRRALADDVVADRLQRLTNRLAPDGAPQERVHTWAPFAARVGIDPLVKAILDTVVPFDGTLREVSL